MSGPLPPLPGDRALIWEHLARSPEERLATLERAVNDLLELRGGRWPEVR